jgi:hypothetical protein
MELVVKYSKGKEEIRAVPAPIGDQPKVCKSDFLFPLGRPDTCYHIVHRFIKELTQKKGEFFKRVEENNLRSREGLEKVRSAGQELVEYINVMKSEQFRNMVESSDCSWKIPSRPRGSDRNNFEREQSNSKQEFDDQVWSVYAEAILLTDTLCRNLFANPSASPHKKTKEQGNFQGRERRDMISTIEID